MASEYDNDPFFHPKVHSSVKAKGKYVTQIITMINGYKKTFVGVDTDTILQSDFTHFNTRDGRKVMVNTKNVLFVEITSEK